MKNNIEHCPYLNQSDARCGEHFSLDELQHAFTHCFGHYRACPVYLDRMIEARLAEEQAGQVAAEHGDVHVATRLVQITIPARHAKRPAGAPRVSAVSRL